MASRIIRANSEELKGINPYSFSANIQEEIRLSSGDEFSSMIDTAPTAEDSQLSEQEQRLSTTSSQQAEAIVQQAQLKAAAVEKEAYEKGYCEGEKAGKEVGEKMVEALLKQYAQTLEELTGLRKQVLTLAEREVVRLSLEIAKKVVKREVTIDEEVILTLVKVALSRLGEESPMTLRVNPRDYQFLVRYRSNQGTSSVLHEGIKLVEDPLISRGGCLIETESGIIDARVEEQFREVEKGFFE